MKLHVLRKRFEDSKAIFVGDLTLEEFHSLMEKQETTEYNHDLVKDMNYLTFDFYRKNMPFNLYIVEENNEIKGAMVMYTESELLKRWCGRILKEEYLSLQNINWIDLKGISLEDFTSLVESTLKEDIDSSKKLILNDDFDDCAESLRQFRKLTNLDAVLFTEPEVYQK